MEPNLNQPQTIANDSNVRKYLQPKFIFLGLGIIILIEVIIGVVSLIKTQSQTGPTTQLSSQVVLTDGSFSLDSAQLKYKVGDQILVSADLSTGNNPVVGADLILHFDPTVLSLSKDSIVAGKAFSSYPLIDVDQKSGTVWISGVSEGTNNLNGVGNFAIMTFSAKLKGSTTVSITYKDGDTKDSNLVSDKGEDVLKKIKNLNLEIN